MIGGEDRRTELADASPTTTPTTTANPNSTHMPTTAYTPTTQVPVNTVNPFSTPGGPNGATWYGSGGPGGGAGPAVLRGGAASPGGGFMGYPPGGMGGAAPNEGDEKRPQVLRPRRRRLVLTREDQPGEDRLTADRDPDGGSALHAVADLVELAHEVVEGPVVDGLGPRTCAMGPSGSSAKRIGFSSPNASCIASVTLLRRSAEASAMTSWMRSASSPEVRRMALGCRWRFFESGAAYLDLDQAVLVRGDADELGEHPLELAGAGHLRVRILRTLSRSIAPNSRSIIHLLP